MSSSFEIAKRYAGVGGGSISKLFGYLRGRGSARTDSSMMSFLSRMSMVGLIIGVALLYTVLSVMNGFDHEMRHRIIGIVPQGVIYLDKVEDKYAWQEYARKMQALPEISGVTPFATLEGLFISGDKSAAAALVGIQKDGEFAEGSLTEFLYKSGDGESRAGGATQMAQVYLGERIARQLGVGADDSVSFVSVSNTGGQSASVYNLSVQGELRTRTEVDNGLAVASISDIAMLRELPDEAFAVDGLRLKFHDIFTASKVVNQVVRESAYALRGDSWIRTHGNLYHAIQMSKRIVSLLMALVIAIAAFNVVSTLVLVVMDKQGDIAILRTMGARKRQILHIFLYLGLFIGVVGAVFGLLAGALLASITPSIVGLLESILGLQFLQSDVYPITYIPVDLRLADSVWIFAVVMLLTFLATLFPAWMATRVRPAQALRYE